MTRFVTIVCEHHLKPHTVAVYSDRAPGLVPGDAISERALRGWWELEAHTAAGRRRRGSIFDRPPGDVRPSQTWGETNWREHALIKVHANACSRCGDNAPLPDKRMQALIERFAEAGVRTVPLPLLREADDLLRAAMDTE